MLQEPLNKSSSPLVAPDATSPLDEWLTYLEQLHSKSIDLGLTRVKQVAERLDILTPAPVVFTVAGTNGKGTTCRTLECICMAAGLRVGVYSSPHLIRYTERVRIQGDELDNALHSQSFARIEAKRGDIALTYFEFSTLSALQLFKQAKLDVVILEVGLGGRLDATNIVDADVSVVTSIDIDHVDWLGSDRETIGREKAGIFRSHRPAIVGEPNMPQSIADVATETGANLFQREVDWSYQLDESEQQWHWRSENLHYDNLPVPNVPLPNAATALAALSQSSLKITQDAIEQGLKKSALPGRFQLIQQLPRVILDVAHNPHAAAYLASRLSTLNHQGGCIRAVVGMLADKDIAATLANLVDQVDQWYCAPLFGPRGGQAELLLQHLPQGKKFDSVTQAYQQAMRDAAANDTVIVCGSFHTVAEVLLLLEEDK